jgi:drug/metabolite transporter (DMT)-like permease
MAHGSIGAMKTLGPLTIGALVVCLTAFSSSAALIVYAAAPALAIAFWRNALAVGVIAPVAAVRQRHELSALLRPGERRRAGMLSILAGLALAVHFGTWVPSAKLTSVAAATALVATQPVWAALIAKLRGIVVPRATWIGVGVAVLGAALATGADVSVSARAVTGDLLALAAGAMGAVYATYGERARTTLSTTVYTTVCYGVCAVVLGLVCVIGGVRLHGFPAQAWLAIAALTAGPQLLGHSTLNYALRRFSATTMSVLMLLEVPGSALLGWLLVHQVPPARSLPGLIVIVIGVGIAVLGAARRGATVAAARAVTAPPGEL